MVTKFRFLSFFIISLFFLNGTFTNLKASEICNNLINESYFFSDRYVEKYDHGIGLEDYDDPDSDKIFILSIENFSPAKEIGLEKFLEIHSIDNVKINDDIKENFDDTIDYIYELMDKDNFSIKVINENSEIINYDITKFTYKSEPEVISNYYIDKIQIINLNREAKARFRIWTDWQNPKFLNYIKKSFNNNNDFFCYYTNQDNIEKILQKFWYPISRVDQTGSTYSLVDVLGVGIDTSLEDPFSITYDIESSVPTDANLKQFPFDTMSFYFDFSYFSGGDLYLADQWLEQLEDGVDRTNQYLYEWQIVDADLTYDEDTYEYGGELVYPLHYLEFELERNTLYYFMKIIFPVIFIVLISFSVFWIKNQEIEAKLNVSIVSLLALIAYNFVYNSELPKLNFITIIDAFVFISYLYSGAATIVSIYSYYDYRRDGQKGEFNSLDIRLRYIAPISYFFIILTSSLFIYNN